MPMFFLPAVFEVNESQLRAQLRLLLAIALVQVPISGQRELARTFASERCLYNARRHRT
jgi:hypothetical protein